MLGALPAPWSLLACLRGLPPFALLGVDAADDIAMGASAFARVGALRVRAPLCGRRKGREKEKMRAGTAADGQRSAASSATLSTTHRRDEARREIKGRERATNTVCVN